MDDKGNGFPGPNLYNIKGFADLVKIRGDKINETRIKLKEKKKLEDLQKQKMAKLREERFEEKKKNMKLSIKEIINNNDNNNNKTETILEMHLDDNNEKKEDNTEDNELQKENQ